MNDKWQALNEFWNSFGIPAYDENSVPDNAVMPYITYSVSVSDFENVLPLAASLWYYQTTWKDISIKADEIARSIGHSFTARKIKDGYMIITKGTPFAQRMADDDTTKRIYINVNVEFCTNY